jgi:hypothetical protein
MNRFRQMLTHDPAMVSTLAGFRRDRHDIEEVHLATEELQVRQQIGFSCTLSTLLTARITGALRHAAC